MTITPNDWDKPHTLEDILFPNWKKDDYTKAGAKYVFELLMEKSDPSFDVQTLRAYIRGMQKYENINPINHEEFMPEFDPKQMTEADILNWVEAGEYGISLMALPPEIEKRQKDFLHDIAAVLDNEE